MRRADRLFQIAQYLCARRLTTAKQLADWLRVSERTIYRDIQDLSLSGVPIEGEAGVGYRVKSGYDLKPLMFLPDEIEALAIGMRMVQAWGGPELAKSGAAALAKMTLALPKEKRDFIEATPLFAPSFHIDKSFGERLELLRKSIKQKQTLQITYHDANHVASQRAIRPLACYFWGGTWSVVAWCELRTDFRSFRLDRIATINVGEHFSEQAGRRLIDFIRTVKKSI